MIQHFDPSQHAGNAGHCKDLGTPFPAQTVGTASVSLDIDGVTISVASPEALLAMKRHAVQHRGNRDIGDVAKLCTIVGIDTVDKAEDLYGEFYPGDEFTPRTYERVERVFAVGLPEPEVPPSPPFANDGQC